MSRRNGESADPRCWWCGIETEAETGYRGDATDLELPPGVGVVVCTPACPERPEGARVWGTPRSLREHPPKKAVRRRRQTAAA